MGLETLPPLFVVCIYAISSTLKSSSGGRVRFWGKKKLLIGTWSRGTWTDLQPRCGEVQEFVYTLQKGRWL